jgi:IclR family transcriptional regulator, mhp operon transcriptional activator
MEQTDPVPGLGRGLALLAHLNREGACSLERLAGDLDFPKSSTSRLLESLVLAGCVIRDQESKRFRAVRALVDLTAAQDRDLRSLLAGEPADLAGRSGNSVEVYAWNEGHLVMIDRADPEDREVVVWARVGWVRPPDEIDSLNMVAMAFGGRAPERNGWRLSDAIPAERIAVPRETAVRLAQHTREQGFAHDITANGRGVLRVSAPLLADGILLGVLALVGSATQPPSADAIAALCATTRRFADRFSPVPPTGARS